MACTTSQYPAQDVAAAFVAGQHAVPDQERERTGMIRNNAERNVVFGVDADLSEPVLKYLSDLSQKKLSLYWNRHRLTQMAKVTVHSIKSRFIERVHAAIETGDPVFVGSDHHNEFRREVVDPLMKLMTKEQRERTHLFTAKDGDHNYLRDPSKLRHAIVFSSPTIVYGIDMNWKGCLLYTSPSPRDRSLTRMPSSA